MIKKFETRHHDAIRQDVESALASVAQKHGIKIGTGKLHYMRDGSSITIEVELATIGQDGAALTKSVTDFKHSCSRYGLKPEHLGAIFTYGGERYRLDGMAGGRSYKYVFAVTRVRDGKRYRLPANATRELQDKNHEVSPAAPVAPNFGQCSNDHAYDEKFNPIGKCSRRATTTRTGGFPARAHGYCDQCAAVIDESRAEMEAEARMS
jgi:hypothetical protein